MRPAEGQQQGYIRYRQQQGSTQDDTTRYLCAAAHLDSAFADEAIREFLLEPTRPVPPSPGIHAASVLVEAVAARTRRKVRDGALAVQALTFVWLAWGSALLHGWIAVAVIASVPAIWRRSATRTAAALKVAGCVAALVAAPFVATRFSADALRALVGNGSFSSGSGGDVQSLAALILCFLMLVTLVTDRLIVWQLAYGRFGRRARHLPPSNPFDQERMILNLSPPGFLRQIVRYAAPTPELGGAAPLVVYRGSDPFIGAGVRRVSWSVALPLEKLPEGKPDGSPFGELTTAGLYESIRMAMNSLRHNDLLSPGERLRGLRTAEAVYVPADKLIDQLNRPEVTAYLSHPDGRPSPLLPAEEVLARRTQPKEWARYYLGFHLAAWAGDLTLSGFVQAAAGDGMFTLEWTQYVLPPVREEYRAIDKPPGGLLTPIREAALRWLKLPASIVGRTVHTLGVLVPAHRERGVFNSDAYGSLRTLREMGADDKVRDHLQLSDVSRYENIMRATLVRAVGTHLRDCGYSPERFERWAEGLPGTNLA
ncbi:hypothetical protein [Amycolatopsis pigmentata]|uniref:Uncharacterized protein n=1 Tax=Amycolatopsis pigmentata TaxID=450801 RepID=A0ABW5FVL0_9PSEU